MRFSKVKIRNYKGISELELDFQPNDLMVTTLVGLNESGKTTILEALDFIQNDIPQARRHELIPKNRKSNFSDEISVTLSLVLDEQDDEEIRLFLLKEKFILTSDEKVKFMTISKKYIFEDSKFIREESSDEIKLIGKRKNGKKIGNLNDLNHELFDHVRYLLIYEHLVPKIIYYQNFLSDIPAKIYLDLNENPDTFEDPLPYYVRMLQDVLDSIDKDLSIEKHVLARLRDLTPENKQSLEAVIHKMEAKITEMIFSTWGKLMGKTKKEIILRHGEEVAPNGERKVYIEMKLKDGSEEFAIGERSLGFRWFFSFLLFTEFRRNRHLDKGKLIFLLDEPASNLHSTAQVKLLATFQDLIQNSQLVYTTHSHHLIKPTWLSGTYIVQNTAMSYEDEMSFNAASTDIKATKYKTFVGKHSDQTEYFQPVLDVLDYQPGPLEKIPNLLVVEGKIDFYIFKYMQDVVLKSKTKINFYPGGGAGKNFPIVRSYIAWGRQLIILMDSDNAGSAAKKKYIDEIGSIIEKQIFIYSDIDPTWHNCSIEDLFTDIEKKVIMNEYFEADKVYNKNDFYCAIQYFLMERKSIKLSAGTIAKFKKIFYFFASKLAGKN